MTRYDIRSGRHESRRAFLRGFTLLELLTTMTVVAVLLTVGVPGFFDIVRSNRSAANANELVSALSIARSEAIRRGARIGICPSSNGAACTGTWSDGWIVFTDTAANDTVNPVVGTVLRVSGPLSGAPAVTATGEGGGAVSWIRFLPRGDVRSNAVLPVGISIQPANCRGDQARSIEINAAGRTIVERVAC
jgi:type IV fimbrial biogenesis protein FimT